MFNLKLWRKCLTFSLPSKKLFYFLINLPEMYSLKCVEEKHTFRRKKIGKFSGKMLSIFLKVSTQSIKWFLSNTAGQSWQCSFEKNMFKVLVRQRSTIKITYGLVGDIRLYNTPSAFSQSWFALIICSLLAKRLNCNLRWPKNLFNKSPLDKSLKIGRMYLCTSGCSDAWCTML